MIKNPSSDDTLIERMCKDILTWDFIDISSDGDICIETHDVVTYKMLDNISNIFRTDSIDIRPTNSNSYYTCAERTDVHTLITVKNAKVKFETILESYEDW